jgi:hypothetical protein
MKSGAKRLAAAYKFRPGAGPDSGFPGPDQSYVLHKTSFHRAVDGAGRL